VIVSADRLTSCSRSELDTPKDTSNTVRFESEGKRLKVEVAKEARYQYLYDTD